MEHSHLKKILTSFSIAATFFLVKPSNTFAFNCPPNNCKMPGMGITDYDSFCKGADPSWEYWADGQCPAGEICCGPEDATPGECVDDKDCPTGQFCSSIYHKCMEDTSAAVPDHYLPPNYDWAGDVKYRCEWNGHPGTQINVGRVGGTSSACVPITVDGLANWILYYATRMAGGIAFALLLYGGILFITAQGDEEKVENAQKTITSAITGLLVIFLATLILKIIGYDILRLPGWGSGAGGLITPSAP